ncbi:hypothetical protein TELCIR_04587 [Teladorsagia circumcincta]|uniref:Uncharacterized protein n=1 Tax=Teladorsagia circumcincta TaxID=45464 RepID=A0A2G9UT71_TELCI|nr:hypothetical protein TELCIR_04587 [Teladorsagia circumcincta]
MNAILGAEDRQRIVDERMATLALLSYSVSIQNYTLEDCQIAYHATTNSLMQEALRMAKDSAVGYGEEHW